MSIREPEPNVQVFELGHYEQMQISIALQVLRDAGRNPDGSITVLAMDAEVLSLVDVAGLEPMFAAHGTVTVIRKNDE